MSSGSGIRTGWILTSGIVGAILFVSAMAWLNSFFAVSRNQEVYRKVLSLSNPKLAELRAQEAEILNSYGWVDQQKGIVRIPVDKAMEIMTREARAARSARQGG